MNHKHDGSLKHMLMMVICCVVPMALLVVLPVLGISLKSGVGLVLVLALCPLLMGGMMWMMPGHAHGAKGIPGKQQSQADQNPFSTGEAAQAQEPALEGGVAPHEPG